MVEERGCPLTAVSPRCTGERMDHPSIYFAAASKPACDALAVRQAEQFGIGGVFRTQETPLGERMC
jgi:hypothetical protein